MWKLRTMGWLPLVVFAILTIVLGYRARKAALRPDFFTPPKKSVEQALGGIRAQQPPTAHRYAWGFARMLDGSPFPGMPECYQSFALAIYVRTNAADRREDSSNVFFFRGKTLGSYRVYGYDSRPECEDALAAFTKRYAPVRRSTTAKITQTRT